MYYKVTLLSLLNGILLAYLTWQKYVGGGCPGCHKVPFIPVTDVTVAIAGLGFSLFLAALIYFSKQVKLFRYAALTLAGVLPVSLRFLRPLKYFLGE